MIKNDTIKKYLPILANRDKDILVLRFGLDGNPPQTLEQVGQKHSISRERVRQIQIVALDMINMEAVKMRLTDRELELIQNAMLFFSEAEQVDDKSEDKIFHSAYDKLGQMYQERE